MLEEARLGSVRVGDGFWKDYIELIRTATIPYQYRAINNDISIDIKNENRIGKFEDNRSNALENLRIAAGWTSGEHYGCVFQDSDVYKWLEAAAYSLIIHPDESLKTLADGVVDLIAAAQLDDGYIDTYFQIREPHLRYRMLHYGHELYSMGHLLEAVAAYYEATGNEKILSVGNKIISHLDATFGYDEGKIKGADGHQEVEIGLIRMYELTGDERALRLCEFFLSVRGEDPDFYKKQVESLRAEGIEHRYHAIAEKLYYLQAYAQPKEQRTAQGHAVRMMYMAAAMARLVRHNGDAALKCACDAIWENVTRRKMFITGGVGSSNEGEAFTGDFDLPNDTMYCETCASIALVFFAYELFKREPKREYIDVLERALYNGILAGAGKDGVHFFYVNPLEIHADDCDNNPTLGHVQYERPEWYSCACCPPNFARAIGSVQRYMYTVDAQKKQVYINLFAQSELRADGLIITQKTAFPAENTVSFEIDGAGYDVNIRLPYWAKNPVIKASCETRITDGYLKLRLDSARVTVDIAFDTPAMAVSASADVVADAGRIAVQKGPFVYCAESVDNEYPLTQYRVCAENIRSAKAVEGLNDNYSGIELPALRETPASQGAELYSFDEPSNCTNTRLRMIPYYLWANRGAREMMVWLHKGTQTC